MTFLTSFALDISVTPRMVLLRRLEDKGVIQMPRIKCAAITEEGVLIVTNGPKEFFLRADHIVLAAGAIPNQEMCQELQGKVPKCYVVGDCRQPRNILAAIHEGAEVGGRI